MPPLFAYKLWYKVLHWNSLFHSLTLSLGALAQRRIALITSSWLGYIGLRSYMSHGLDIACSEIFILFASASPSNNKRPKTYIAIIHTRGQTRIVCSVNVRWGERWGMNHTTLYYGDKREKKKTYITSKTNKSPFLRRRATFWYLNQITCGLRHMGVLILHIVYGIRCGMGQVDARAVSFLSGRCRYGWEAAILFVRECFPCVISGPVDTSRNRIDDRMRPTAAYSWTVALSMSDVHIFIVSSL